MSFLLVAALSNQLWFSTQQDARYYTITPMVNLDSSCECTISIEVQRKGSQGESRSLQQRHISLEAKKEHALGQMKFNVSQGDRVDITVTLSNGSNIEMKKQWSSSSEV
ncbi:aggregative fimbriae synthesis protein [Budviciaceae bacterium CWB-B4]|uniref:Curli assembly protein CsgC n=1 Tax=Limnobaculum xujianqingii TaxID=2738837 RepID=A0A9D7AFQ9_9GAMM|nr:curli assembly chaperone CsgC [Limnobaculum xujianqingii]MBK5071898.1 aggregative fimbriae synthesis protein [Limnobaculum xujianqingii]MBK5175207.1 aggregative fimbriae synthesis protein [Limnobaculum xujianqingii]